MFGSLLLDAWRQDRKLFRLLVTINNLTDIL